MRDHRELRARLTDFVDGDLAGAERAAVERHLEECDECLAETDELLTLRARARALPREIAPPRDLWPEIAARIQPPAPRAAEVIEVDFRTRTRRPVWRQWGWLAAASVALVVLSSGVTAHLLTKRGGPVVATLPEVQVRQTEERPVGLAAFQAGEAEYRATVETLRAELDGRRAQLQPETVATIERNLQIIDQAIVEARAALAADPSNAELPHLLSGVYRKKVELLQRAVQLPAART